MKYLISETTKKEREQIVKRALTITLLGTEKPSDEVLDLAKEYIEGETELSEIYIKTLKKYKLEKK